LAAIYVQNAGLDTLYYAHTDYQGSLTALSLANGTVVERYAYDPWGNRRNPANWTQADTRTSFIFNRGYTMHEHLPEFSLINMNGRVYDPLTSMFLSPDPYLQAPGDWLNYNRYSYAYGNPFKYTDPDGEWFWLIPAAVGFAFNYVSYGIQNGDWGWSAIGSGAIGAASATLMYFSGGATSAASIANGFASAAGNSYGVTVALGFSARYAGAALLNTAFSAMMPSMSVPLGDNFSLSVSPGFGFGSSGLVGGINVSGTYHDGDNAYTLGIGENTNSISASFGYSNKNWGLSYSYTRYGDAVGPDGLPNRQSVGGLSFWSGKFSARIENDFLALNGDRWRSNAVELGFWGGKAVAGTTLYNNYMKDGDEVDKSGSYYHKNLFGKKYGRWVNGQTYSSPLYVGFRSGNNITRLGYSHRAFQHYAQNIGAHKRGFLGIPLFGHANYFMGYDDFSTGTYGYSGYYNPYSLWGR
jgi:RHS repeat-associated protein